jgi:hypothetical protein
LPRRFAICDGSDQHRFATELLRRSEIPNPKLEIRNKFEIRRLEIRDWHKSAVIICLGPSNLGFRICFEFRISYLRIL